MSALYFGKGGSESHVTPLPVSHQFLVSKITKQMRQTEGQVLLGFQLNNTDNIRNSTLVLLGQLSNIFKRT